MHERTPFICDPSQTCVRANVRVTRTHKTPCIWQSLDRFGEERLDEMLTVITSILTAAPEEDEVGAAEEQGEDDEAMSHAGSH